MSRIFLLLSTTITSRERCRFPGPFPPRTPPPRTSSIRSSRCNITRANPRVIPYRRPRLPAFSSIPMTTRLSRSSAAMCPPRLTFNNWRGAGSSRPSLSLQDRDAGDALLPLGGAGLVHAGALGVDGDGDGHVFDVEFVNGFHAEIFEGEEARALDRFGDEISGAADGHEVDSAEFADGVDGGGAALGFADHTEKACFSEHLAGELIHARGGGRASGTDDFFADRVDRTHVVDEAIAEVDGEFFAAIEHVSHALVRGVAAGEELAGAE